MIALRFQHFALVAIAVALAGCGGSPASIGASVSMPQSHLAPIRAGRESWMLPEARDQNLLYTAADNAVYVYTYPRGRLVGALGSFNGAEGLCTDKAGDVFVTAFYDDAVYEYPHGSTKQIAVLGSPYPVLACSVDPQTGNVAAASSYNEAVVFPYKPGRGYGFAKARLNPLVSDGAALTYDKHGDLFMDGTIYLNTGFVLTELPNGAKAFEIITLDQTIDGPGSLQWKGTSLSVADRGNGGGSGLPAVLYRFAISGSTGTKVGTTALADSTAYAQFWIQGNKVVGPEAASNNGIGLWSYPAGGAPGKTIAGRSPNGVVVSLK